MRSLVWRTAIPSLFVLLANYASAQWQIQESHTRAGLRGVHAVSASVAWASGTEGTVLRTLDGGSTWTKCSVPPDGDKLDFRAVWAWSGDEAEVMAAGPGEASRVYRTTDACVHWTEVIRNHDKEGFWDAMVYGQSRDGILVGDPVRGRFPMLVCSSEHEWRSSDSACAAQPDEAAFAGSNSSVFLFGQGRFALGTGGKSGARILLSARLIHEAAGNSCSGVAVTVGNGTDSSGVFSLYFRDRKHGVAVGGDYKLPKETTRTAAFTSDGGKHWISATRPPHGYRSSVMWDPHSKVWIAAGTNGSDLSRDGGKTWERLDDGNWNALSLPFVVGPDGRIGKLER